MSRTRPDLTHVPLADRATCCQCGDPLDAKASGVAQLVKGWRVNRAQGGANMIALAEPQGAYLCRFCLEDRRKGRAWTQLGLFDEEP